MYPHLIEISRNVADNAHAKGGQIVDATMIQAPRQHNSQDEKAAIKAGEIPEAWKDNSAKRAQKDRDARWTVKYSKAKQPTQTPTSAATKQHDIAIPLFGYKTMPGSTGRMGRREMAGLCGLSRRGEICPLRRGAVPR
jgi:hypothetical protein